MKKVGHTRSKMIKPEILDNTQGSVEDEYLAFFQYIFALFKKAERISKITNDRFFNIGDQAVRLHFAGNGLNSALTPALKHLELSPVKSPDLSVFLWDNVSTGTDLPKVISKYFDILGEWWLHLGIRGEIKELSNSRILTAYHLGPNIFSMIDLSKNLALYWVKDAGALPYHELSSPLKTILHWWANNNGLQFAHSGAVGTQDGGVLLVGKGGSGKSTTSLACLRSGMLYAADDYCLLSTDPTPYVYSIYNTAKLRSDLDLERFPNLIPHFSNNDHLEDDKALFFLNEHFPERISCGFPIKAILLPVVTKEKKTRLKPASAGEVLRALAPSTLLQLPGAGKADIKIMSKLIHKVPGYTLELGSDISSIHQVIEKAISMGINS